MKKIVVAAVLLLCARARSQPFAGDTIVRNVFVGFHYDTSIFPDYWLPDPINAWGQQIAPAEVQRSKTVAIIALNKYPADMLKKDLRSVYFLRSMKFFDTNYGGTDSIDALYLTNDGVPKKYSNQDI